MTKFSSLYKKGKKVQYSRTYTYNKLFVVIWTKRNGNNQFYAENQTMNININVSIKNKTNVCITYNVSIIMFKLSDVFKI